MDGMRNNNKARKLVVNTSTVRVLSPGDMANVNGAGGPVYTESGCSFCNSECTAANLRARCAGGN